MSATSRIAFNRSQAAQPASNLWGPMGAAAIAGKDAPTGPSITGAVRGATQPAVIGGGATFWQVIVGLAVFIGAWWAITLILDKLLPLKDTPHFIIDFLHTFKIAIPVGVWFILWKMTAGVAPFKNVPPYVTIATGL